MTYCGAYTGGYVLMTTGPKAVRLEDYSLDEIVQLLVSGAPVSRSNGQVFCLDTEDKRKAFAFYGRNRGLWPRARSIQAREVEELLRALGSNLPATDTSVVGRPIEKPVWHLQRIEAHRFGGLHRHCGADGSDPAPFILDLDKEVTLISGFNGAGKTALLNTVVWCLTGKALRSQHIPHEIHEPMSVTWSAGPADGKATDGDEDEDGEPAKILVPPVVPVPSGADLEVLNDRPKLDSWVRLTFRRESTDETCIVTRRLDAATGRKITAPVEGLKALGLPVLALEVGTLMPGVAAQMRFDEKTDFTQAVSQLTGLKPLEELGQRTQRLINRLKKDEKNATEKAREDKAKDFETKRQTLIEMWEEEADLGPPARILSPGKKEVENEHRIDSASSIIAARERLQRAQTGMSAAMETILGRRLEFATREDVNNVLVLLDDAADQLKGPALGALPSVQLIKALGSISEEDGASASALIEDILERARTLAAKLEDKRVAARWRLYARVAAWHKDQHPDDELRNCPVCGTDLSDVPQDALLDMSVRAALDQCRAADADIAKTATEWERDEAAALLNALPESLRGFADRKLPDTLIDLYRKGFVDELLGQSAFAGCLQPLQKNGRAVWDEAVRENPLPPAPVAQETTLPTVFGGGTLQSRLTAIAHALTLAAHRREAGEALKGLVERYVGTARGTDNAERKSERVEEKVTERAPLRAQIEAIRRAVQNAAPIVSLIRQLDELERIRQAWEADNGRLALLARAADAVTPFLEFPDLVYERVSGLINTLNRDTTKWLNRIYRAHYLDGPSYGGFEPREESGFGLQAGIGNMRVPAHKIMNASQLRACVWAFLFSFWEHVRAQVGGLSCILLDDPQTHFDPMNSENLAAAIPAMPRHGMRPLITSNDSRFVASVQDKLPSRAADSPTWTALRLDPIHSSKLTATLSPAIEEIRERRDRWREDRNDAFRAQDFVRCVRVDIENRLWNLLATDPLVMHSPTLGDLLKQLRGARNRGEEPFSEPPFEKLLSHPDLRDDARFYQIINKAHHRPAEITPQDASDIDQVYENVHGLLRSCTASYARFLGRLTQEDRDLLLADAPRPPEPATFRAEAFPVIGRLAARSGSSSLAISEEPELLQLEERFGSLAMYAVRGPTLGSVALAGQVVLTALDRDAQEGEPVIALHGGKIYARRFHRDKRDLSRTILAPDRSGTERVPPVLMVPSAATRVLPIVGIMYDALSPSGQDEAVLVNDTNILSRQLVAAHVVDDSAHPVIRDGDMVLMEAIEDLTSSQLATLEGRIVAVAGTNGGESFGYLKRLGEEVGEGVRVFENIGLNGRAVAIALNPRAARQAPDLLTLERLWRVHGVLRTAKQR